MSLKIFLKQMFVCSGPWTHYFLIGINAGFQTVLVPQLRKQNQTISLDQFSLLAALQIYSGIPWVIILSILINMIGRKKSYIIVCICSLITFIGFYYSDNITHFLIAQIFFGALSSSYFTTGIVILAECSSAKYRGIFLTFKTATSFWGVLVANAIGTCFHWRTITILGVICSLYTLLTIMIWPESPIWLAKKGRFVECAAVHRWLKGTGDESEKELENVLKSYENRKFVRPSCSLLYLYKEICCKQFCKPVSLACLLICTHCFSGKVVCTFYSLDILKKITNSESTAYSGMLILDAVSVGTMYLGSLISRFFNRRSMLISFSIVGITFMIFIAVYLYLAKLSVIEENKHVTISFLALYSMSIGLGPIIMTTSILAEILPLESRSLAICIIALFYKLINGTSLKLTPLYFKYFEMHGTFAFFAISSIICLVILYYYLPETKDKTLQEINAFFNDDNRLSNAENTELMKSERRNKNN